MNDTQKLIDTMLSKELKRAIARGLKDRNGTTVKLEPHLCAEVGRWFDVITQLNLPPAGFKLDIGVFLGVWPESYNLTEGAASFRYDVIQNPAKRADELLHKLWTKAVDTAGYDKEEWKELEGYVAKLDSVNI